MEEEIIDVEQKYEALMKEILKENDLDEIPETIDEFELNE